MLQAMDILQSLHPKLKMFSQKLHTYLLKPLIKFQALTPVIEEKDNCFTLKLTKKKIHSEKFTKATANGMYRFLFGKCISPEEKC